MPNPNMSLLSQRVRRRKSRSQRIGRAKWGNAVLTQFGLERRGSQYRRALAQHLREYRAHGWTF